MFYLKCYFYTFILMLVIFLNIYIYYVYFVKMHINYLHKMLMKKLNTKVVYLVFGTRPEVIKMYPIIKELEKNRNYFTYITICTYQQEEMVKQILDDFHIIPDINLNVMKKKQSLSFLSSKLFSQLDSIYSNRLPDITIVQGDTTTALIGALCSFYHKVPVAHIEAGLRTKELYFPFPEELNRQTISNIAKYNFCPTKLAATNLINENKDTSGIFVVGNTVIDTLNNIYRKEQNSPKTSYIKEFIKQIKIKLLIKHIILLTVHRRENNGNNMINIFKAVYIILKKYQNICIIYPIHLNPNVYNSIKRTLPAYILNSIINKKYIDSKKYNYMNRFLIVQPLGYFSLIYLLNQSYFIMTDSGGIQEEAVSLRKPILVLRNTTERMEGVLVNAAKLIGTDFDNVYYFAEKLITNKEIYNSMILNSNLYGNGSSAKQIVDILKTDIKHRNYLFKNVVIVLTIWKRNNIVMQLNMIKKQTILKSIDVSVIIYQNANHINIEGDINEWKKNNTFVNVNILHTAYETGYYGRFLVPLTTNKINSYFIICDDDVLFGEKYFENMLRVVDDGCIATRNGRYIGFDGKEIITDIFTKGHFTWESDLEYDFGGHIWAGRIEWLKLAWKHPSPTILNCEDAWISVVLKKYYNIKTKVPKCPFNNNSSHNPSMCACSDISAKQHTKPILGNNTLSDSTRILSLKVIKNYFNFRGIIETNYSIYSEVKHSKTLHNSSIYDFNGDIMGERCLYFV